MKQYNVIDALLNYEDGSLDFSREVSCFALPYLGIISSTSNNSAGSVEFDWFTIKDKIWEVKKRENGDSLINVAYMLHTHPPLLNRMSSIDRNMVHGWCTALGIPIWFLVITQDEVVTYICALNQDTKKVERDLVDLSLHEDVCSDLKLISKVMYGLSKSGEFNSEIFDRVMNSVKDSGLSFDKIHEWDMFRPWNQIVYTE